MVGVLCLVDELKYFPAAYSTFPFTDVTIMLLPEMMPIPCED